MTYYPVVIVGDNAVVLSINVDDRTRMTTEYRIENNTAGTVAINVDSSKGPIRDTAVPPGTWTRNIPGSVRWNYDLDEATAFGISVRLAV